MDSEVTVTLIAGGLLSGMGVVMIVGAMITLLRQAMQRWQAVDGRIEGLEIDDIADTRSHTITIVFSYEIDGQTFTGRHLAHDIPEPYTGNSDKLSRFYPKGQPVTVYIKRHNPNSPLLDRGSDDAAFTAFVLAGAGAISLFFGLRALEVLA